MGNSVRQPVILEDKTKLTHVEVFSTFHQTEIWESVCVFAEAEELQQAEVAWGFVSEN